jgi:hypothetical protein
MHSLEEEGTVTEAKVIRFDWAAMVATMIMILACAVTAYVSAEYGRRVGALEAGQVSHVGELAVQAQRLPLFLDTMDTTPIGAKAAMYQVRWIDEYSQVRQVWVNDPLTRDRLIAWIQGEVTP